MHVDIELKTITGMESTRHLNIQGFRKDDDGGIWRIELKVGNSMVGLKFPTADNRDKAYDLLNAGGSTVVIPIELFWFDPVTGAVELHEVPFRYIKKAISLAATHSGVHPTRLDALRGLSDHIVPSLIRGIKPSVDLKYLAKRWARVFCVPKEHRTTPLTFYQQLLQ